LNSRQGIAKLWGRAKHLTTARASQQQGEPVQFQSFGPDGIKTVNVPRWAAVLIGAVVIAASLALLVLAATAALILLPVLMVAGLIYGWWFRRKLARMGREGWPEPDGSRSPREGDIIDAEFVVIEPTEPRAPDNRRIGHVNNPRS
jgi:Zn-dependent protease with chaperone function